MPFAEPNGGVIVKPIAMIRATRVFPAAEWSHVATDSVLLDFDERHRRRIAMKGARGVEFLLDLPQATAVREGDGLLLEDGRIVEVKAAAEPLAEITARSVAELVRIAWHLGNRHLPTQLLDGRLRIRRDHVIEAMVAGLGGTVSAVSAPFDPEAGAYSHGHAHVHDHGSGHAQEHDHHGHDHG
jgi:urease accessory protein